MSEDALKDASSGQNNNDVLIKVDNLKKYFPIKRGLLSRTVGEVKAVDGVSFAINKGETIGLVGESGCGKTTVGRSILRLIEPTSGKITFKDRDICSLNSSALRNIRKEIQIIFQDPYSSLNPRMTVGNIVGESLSVFRIAAGKERQEIVEELFRKVGLQPDSTHLYPHEFSGGQRQRIGIARAIALNPDFIVCDEAVSALDVSIQAQVINLLIDLRDELNLSYLFIAHDLAVVKHISHRIAVMYLGRIVEFADSKELFDNPLHPYTQALLSAIPHVDLSKRSKRTILKGEVPSPVNPPSGCPFHPRCPKVMDICKSEFPPEKVLDNRHIVYCYLHS